jgi:non-specific serine/threonine protein kinase
VPATIAKVLGVREEDAGLLERLGATLADKQLLLVLDNFERLVDAAAVVADLLARAPCLKVLVTSRTPLHVYGEREFPLPPFALPDMDRLPSVERLCLYEAVRLFIERAQAVKPDFAVTSANAPAVAEICSRLDGLPLAIELAAARVKVLPPQALLKRLEQRLPLLTGGAQTLPARQQTMRDAIAWSHDLLSPEEQIVFRRLAVFPGGCTIDAAEAVARAEDALDVFATMAGLVDESLLRQEEGTDGEPRFRMFETIREYGSERLAASGEGDDVSRRLAAWYVAFAEMAYPGLLGASMEKSWIDRLDRESPNLRAAVTWLLANGQEPRALRLLVATEDYWTQRISKADHRQWLLAGLAGGADAPAVDRAVAHNMIAFAAATAGDYEQASVHARYALSAAEESAEPAAIGLAHYTDGLVWEQRGDGQRAAAAFAKTVPILREAGNESFAMWVQADLADKLVWLGDLEAAVPMLEEALASFRAMGNTTGIAMATGQRGMAALAQEDLPFAARLFAESLDAARRIPFERFVLGATAGLAGVALAFGQPERAARLLGATDGARASLGMKRISHALHTDRITTATRDALGTPAFEEAWSGGMVLSYEETVAEALALADEVASGARP